MRKHEAGGGQGRSGESPSETGTVQPDIGLRVWAGTAGLGGSSPLRLGMPRRLVRFYQQSRLLNINLNLVLAGFLAIALAKYPVMLVERWLAGHALLITVIAYAIDTTFDVAAYFGLHWVANHWKPRAVHGRDEPPPLPKHRRNFLLDAGRVQAERLVLVPVFAAVSMGMMYGLQKYAGVPASWAFVYGFATAIVVTRTLHTISGIWTGTFKSDHHFAEGTAPPDPAAPAPIGKPRPSRERSAV
ncbi:MAG: hypothetical protein KatS3mg103_0065 [Phycisphaerales bacterium]|nr:MAG: hypothetical protein KatS3mg103_0065 [Phycisphaerales bacterium]